MLHQQCSHWRGGRHCEKTDNDDPYLQNDSEELDSKWEVLENTSFHLCCLCFPLYICTTVILDKICLTRYIY